MRMPRLQWHLYYGKHWNAYWLRDFRSVGVNIGRLAIWIDY